MTVKAIYNDGKIYLDKDFFKPSRIEDRIDTTIINSGKKYNKLFTLDIIRHFVLYQ
tara:strand:+ start:71 stop:238 length:168 start_codon:yes stop_codon:yes gene_type:complete